jgi:hypothetical protein
MAGEPDDFLNVLSPPRKVADVQAQDDYTQARGDVVRFYNIHAHIQEDLYDGCRAALEDFRDLHHSLPNLGLEANLMYQAIRVALGILPGSSIVIKAFELLHKALPLAESAARMASAAGVVLQRSASGVYNAVMAQADKRELASYAADRGKFLDALEGAAKKRIFAEQDDMTDVVDRLKAQNKVRGQLRELVAHSHPRPQYEPEALAKFRERYELQLYLDYYKHKVTVETVVQFRRSWVVIKGMPEDVQRQVAKLAKRAPHWAFWGSGTPVKSAKIVRTTATTFQIPSGLMWRVE